MNQPLRVTGITTEGKKLYSGDKIPKYANRKQRRTIIQKSKRNPMFNLPFYDFYIQRIWNNKTSKEKQILHYKG